MKEDHLTEKDAIEALQLLRSIDKQVGRGVDLLSDLTGFLGGKSERIRVDAHPVDDDGDDIDLDEDFSPGSSVLPAVLDLLKTVIQSRSRGPMKWD